MDDPQPLPQRGSSQESLEMDILKLSARWEAQRTIRTGDTPGQALRKGVQAMRCGACMHTCRSSVNCPPSTADLLLLWCAGS